jgi:tetratricopeptide (TPR) repeat protein
MFAGEHALAEDVADRALLLNPSSATGWFAKANAACLRDQSDVAIGAFMHALRLSPLDPLRGYIKGGLALACLGAGHFGDASRWATESLAELPRYSFAMRVKVAACAHLGRYEEAGEWLVRLLQMVPGLTIRSWRAATTSTGTVLDRFEAGLRKAGLPED